MTRLLAFLGLLLLAACTDPNDLDEAPAYLGNFQLGHNVVVAPNLTKGPASREASAEEWIAAMTEAVTDRFTRYEGGKLYHLGISIEGYVLAVPGVPLVASPKSALILHVTVWDDAAGRKLNEEPHLVTVMESISGNTILGSGLTQTKEVQLENLARNAAKLIETWLIRQNTKFGWFEDDAQPDTGAVAGDNPPDSPDQIAAQTGPMQADSGESSQATAPSSARPTRPEMRPQGLAPRAQAQAPATPEAVE